MTKDIENTNDIMKIYDKYLQTLGFVKLNVWMENEVWFLCMMGKREIDKTRKIWFCPERYAAMCVFWR